MTTSRRRFLQGAAATAAALSLPACQGLPRAARIAGKARLGVIGVGGRGGDNLNGTAQEDIVALCDVDQAILARTAERFPRARTFADFRELLQLPDLDGVVVSTPDHTHFLPAALALQRGLHVYCEKPLCHTVAEVRELRRLAAATGAVTQMGTQIHSLPNYRRVVERVRQGVLGPITEVHVFVNGTQWAGRGRPSGGNLPPTLDWQLWLGPAPERPYADGYHPAGWRRYWDFGGGTMADMACHFTDLAFWALDLDAPTEVQADGPDPDSEAAPPGLRVRYAFPARGERPALALTWYDGNHRPPDEVLKARGLDGWKNGVLFVGRDGWLCSDYTRHVIGPDAVAATAPPPESIAASPGHYAEWLDAMRGGPAPLCAFDYSGPLTEAVLLGVASHRAGNVKTSWDGSAMRAGHPDVQALLHKTVRPGWEA